MGYLGCPAISERALPSKGPYTTATDPKTCHVNCIGYWTTLSVTTSDEPWKYAYGTDNSYIFHITQMVKQSAPGKAQPVLVIPRFPYDESLCVATVLDEYIKRTEVLRGSEKTVVY